MAVLLGIVCAFTEAGMGVDMRANGMLARSNLLCECNPILTLRNPGQYAFIMLYNIVYGITWGPMPWLLPAEIFPLRSRSKGMALATVRMDYI